MEIARALALFYSSLSRSFPCIVSSVILSSARSEILLDRLVTKWDGTVSSGTVVSGASNF